MHSFFEFIYLVHPESFRGYRLMEDSNNASPRQQKSIIGQNYPIEGYCDRHYGNLFFYRQPESAILEWRKPGHALGYNTALREDGEALSFIYCLCCAD